MKVFKSVPQQGEVFSHEAPTARILSSLTVFFLLISAVSVTAAWSVFLEDLLKPLGLFRWVVLLVWGLIFVLPVEVMIFELSKYFWRSIVKGYTKGEHGGQFWTATVLLLLGLAYSGFMSQKATRSAMLNAAPKASQIETGDIYTEYDAKVRRASLDYSENVEAVDRRFSELEKAVSRKYDARVDSLQGEYAIWSAKGPRYQRRVDNISRQIAAANLAKSGELQNLAVTKSGEEAEFLAAKTEAEKQAAKVRDANLEIATSKTTGANADTASFAKIFSGIVSLVAAFAVFFVFILARFLELFYHRTKVERVVILENADIFGGAVIDAIRFPFVWVNRKLAVWVAEKYKALPDSPQPVPPEVVYDPTGAVVHVRPAFTLSQGGAPQAQAGPASVPPVTAQPPVAPPLSPQPVQTVNKNALVNPVQVTTFLPVSNPQPLNIDPPVSAPLPAKNPLPDPGLSALDSFSLKGSKPGEGEPAKVSKAIPPDLEDLIKAAFKNPVPVPGFYAAMGISPSEFSTAFDYIEKLKKTARNAQTAINKPGGKESTREANRRRFALVEAELGRLYVGIVPGDSGPGSIKFTWLSPASQADWKNRAERLAKS